MSFDPTSLFSPSSTSPAPPAQPLSTQPASTSIVTFVCGIIAAALFIGVILIAARYYVVRARIRDWQARISARTLQLAIERDTRPPPSGNMYRATSVGVAAAALSAAALAAVATAEEEEDLGRVALLLRRCRGVMRLVEQPDSSFALGVGLSEEDSAGEGETAEAGQRQEEGGSEAAGGQETRGGAQGAGMGTASERCLEMGVRGVAVLESVPEVEEREVPHHT